MDYKKRSIIELDIIKEWDYSRNIDILPENLTLGSQKKVYWYCEKHNYSYMQVIRNKVNGQLSCPQCIKERQENQGRLKYLKNKKTLAETHPHLINEWVECENPDITPFNCTSGSKLKVKWKCLKGHEWSAAIQQRTKGSGCIYCSGQRAITGENDLVTLNPELASQWDYDKNGDLKPENFKVQSNKKVWWKCELGHSWQATINHRTNGTGCPKCYSENQTSFPEQAICYYLSQCFNVSNRKIINCYEIDIYIEDLKIGIEYDGIYYHSDEKSKQKENRKNQQLLKEGIKLYRVKEANYDSIDETNNIIYVQIDRQYLYIENILKILSKMLHCDLGEINIQKDKIKIYNAYVQNVKNNSITKKFPKLAEEWDYEKNINLLPEYFTAGSNVKVWWKCSNCNSLYEASIMHRVDGTACPYCAGKKVNETNNLAIKYPELLKSWDYEKNLNLSPDNIYYSSRQKVWWKCLKCGKSYQMAICSKIKVLNDMCSNCRHKKLGEINQLKAAMKDDSILVSNSELIKEWDYDKNLLISPELVSIKSGKVVWWKCSKCGHSWKTRIINRTNGNHCPMCYRLSERKKKNINVYLDDYTFYGTFEGAKKICEHFNIDYDNFKSIISNVCNKKKGKFLKKYYLRFADNDELNKNSC